MFVHLGTIIFEFYIDDNTADEEIKKKVDEKCNYSVDYNVEPGYENMLDFVIIRKAYITNV